MRPCSRLQASAVAFGESLAIPEIVAIGGQVSQRYEIAQLASICLAFRSLENFSYTSELMGLPVQSDGKSTLLEAFLGFRFNVRCTSLLGSLS